MRRRRLIPWLVAVGAFAVVAWLAAPYIRTAAFLLDMSGSQSAVRRWLPVRVADVVTEDLRVPTRDGAIAARKYAPASRAVASVIVFPGVHAGGVDEPRLDTFARRLAGTGLLVVAVPLPDLRAFQITARATNQIEDAIVWMTDDHGLAPTGRVAVVGVSFSGGLAIVAAGRPRLANRITTVVSLGGHANLPRTMRYLCTGQLGDGTFRAPHEYGAAVILLSAADRLVPADQVDAFRRSVTDFLDASSVASTDTVRAESMLAEVRTRAGSLRDPSRTLMHEVMTADIADLGPKLLPFVDALGSDPALSPDRSPAPAVPVFLMHGSADNVIPSTEAPLLEAYLRGHGTPEVTTLISPFLTHTSIAEHIGASDAWNLIRFWRKVFSTAAGS